MEVHHHPDIHHKPKKWKEYFLEFLMIFLAVTLGFFAESMREKIVNNDKERHYMESLTQDLKRDTLEMSDIIFKQNYIIRQIDSALQTPVEKLTEISTQDIFYHHFVYFYSFDFLFVQHDKTFTQLKNAGGFGVIKENAVADSIAELYLFYDQQVKFDGDYYDDYERKLIDIAAQLMKMSELPHYDDALPNLQNVELITRYDPALLQQLYTWIRNLKNCLLAYMSEETEYRSMVVRLINFINKEYHLEQ